MLPIGKETTDFVLACEAIQALLVIGPLAPKEQDLVEFSASKLLANLRFG